MRTNLKQAFLLCGVQRPRFEDDAAGAKVGILRETPTANVIVPATPLDLTSLESVRV